MDKHNTALPGAFAERMQGLLGGEYEAFEASYGQGRQYGLRRNLLKGTEEEFIRVMPFPLEKISWAREGYYYDAAALPGRHVLHEAGAYYIQEPSAMAAVEALAPKPGERILDLCAAPGGKSTQIAGRMQGRGLLVSNEVIGERARILSQNVERMGVAGCVVCSEKPERIASLFPAFFDRVLVDAPCSGEGMFRKEEAAREEWSPGIVQMCAERQALILEEAAKTVKPGGVLVYSTCTFSPEENEGTISAFLRVHEEYSIEETALEDMFSPGREEWTGHPAAGIGHTLRLWPHLIRGEGHYIARLRKRGNVTEELRESAAQKAGAGKADWQLTGDRKLCKLIENFLREELEIGEVWRARHPGRLIRFGDQIYLMPEEMGSLTGIKVLRPGLQLATEKKNRFEPAHALALSLLTGDSGRMYRLTEQEAAAYLRGESVACGEERGWMALSYEGYTLGFGKASGGQIKNHYPKGLRKSL
ncbi:MAG: RsmF rRNA methyltransferase first C-terminal domain-containing protein [Lachnospiraceae bacterium]|nr:RsmF rRNA methyltransferase first C-terminal domain-containing protein [Lachnospiraceae bacterium]